MEYQQTLLSLDTSNGSESASKQVGIPLNQGAKNFFNCDYCGKYNKRKPSQILKHTTHFCSKDCYNLSLPKKQILNCLYCQKEFIAYKYQNKKYCNKSCGHKGKPFSEEHKRKIGVSNLGKPRSLELRKRLSLLMIGKHHSPKTEFKKGYVPILTIKSREKIRLKLIGKPKPEGYGEKLSKIKKTQYNNPEFKQYYLKINKGVFQKGHKPTLGMTGIKHLEESKLKMALSHSGEKCHLWRGGISREPYDMNFNNLLKKQIRERDNYTCQQCGLHQNQLFYKNGTKHCKLHIHHIDYNKKNTSPNNLISLCASCHTPTTYGDRWSWTSYFQNLIGIKLLFNPQLNSSIIPP